MEDSIVQINLLDSFNKFSKVYDIQKGLPLTQYVKEIWTCKVFLGIYLCSTQYTHSTKQSCYIL